MAVNFNHLSKIKEFVIHHPVKCVVGLGVILYVIRALKEWKTLNTEHYKNRELPDLRYHVVEMLRKKQYQELNDLLTQSTPYVASYLFWTYITVPNYQGRCPMHLIAGAIHLIPSQRGKGGIKRSEHEQLESVSSEIQRIYEKVDEEVKTKSFFPWLMIDLVGRSWNAAEWWHNGYDPSSDDIEKIS